MLRGWRRRVEAEALKKEKIRKEVDEPQQRCRNIRGEHANADGEHSNWKNPCCRCEIAEVFECVVMSR
jgi:hypothetical protein